MDASLEAGDRLPLCSLSTYGHITPSFALARLTVLLRLLHSLLRCPPQTVALPLSPLVSTLLHLLDCFVPAGRRGEEASCNGTALSPREQWLLFPLVYPSVLDALAFTFRRIGSQVLVVSQDVVTSLRMFFLRCYREYDVSITIHTMQCIR